MKNSTSIFLAVILTSALSIPYSTAVLAEQTATQKMARIVADLNHRPSAGDKETLRSITQKGSEAEKTIANALMMMDHNVSSSDKEKLRTIAKDRSVPDDTRELANIVQNMKHQASSKEKMLLKGM